MKESLTCIVIDDDPLFVRKMEAFIHQIEWLDLQASFNAPVKAAAAIISIKPDIVFLDLEMPHMSGYELVDWLFPILRLRELETRMVAVSGNNPSEHAMLDQFLCHIHKSRLDNHSVLVGELTRHLGRVPA